MGTRVTLAQQVRHIHAHCHLYALQCIQGQQAQFFIEHIQAHHVFKAATRDKVIQAHSLASRHRCCEVHGTQGIPVAAQAVVAQALQIVERCSAVFNFETTSLEQLQLMGKR